MLAHSLVILLLVLLNGFFALSELAVVTSRRSRLEQLAIEGRRGASAALRLAQEASRFLAAVQVGITLVGIFAGAFGGATLAAGLAPVLATWPPLASIATPVSLVLVVVSITYLSIVMGELVPKRLALQDPERLACLIAPFMVVISQVMRPLVWLLHHSSGLLLKGLGVSGAPPSRVTEEEVKTMIAEGTRSGVFEPAERAMIEGVMRLSDRTVRSIMTPRPDILWLDPDLPPDELRDTITDGGHSRFPLSRGDLDDILGIVHVKDIIDPALRGEPLDLEGSLVEPLVVHEGTPVFRLLELFRQSAVHMAVVVDEYGSVEGIVTVTDVLESIAGDLPEEGQEPEPTVTRREDGSLLVDGMLPIDELEPVLDREMAGEEDDYLTLAGFVLSRLGRVPSAAEHFSWRGYRFEVVDMDGHRIDKVLVTPTDQGSTHQGDEEEGQR